MRGEVRRVGLTMVGFEGLVDFASPGHCKPRGGTFFTRYLTLQGNICQSGVGLLGCRQVGGPRVCSQDFREVFKKLKECQKLQFGLNYRSLDKC